MNHLAVHQIVRWFEMRNFQGAHSLNGHRDGLLGAAYDARLPQALSCGPQSAENLRPIKSLTFTVIAETHMGVPRLPLVRHSGSQTCRRAPDVQAGRSGSTRPRIIPQ